MEDQGLMYVLITVVAAFLTYAAWSLAREHSGMKPWDMIQAIFVNMHVGMIGAVLVIIFAITFVFNYFLGQIPEWEATKRVVNTAAWVVDLFADRPDWAMDEGEDIPEGEQVPGADLFSGALNGLTVPDTPPAQTEPQPNSIMDTRPEDRAQAVACWKEASWPKMRSATGGSTSWVPNGEVMIVEWQGVGFDWGSPKYWVTITNMGTGRFNIGRDLGESYRKLLSTSGDTLIGTGPWPYWRDCPVAAKNAGVGTSTSTNTDWTVVAISEQTGLTMVGDSLALYAIGNGNAPTRVITKAQLPSFSACGTVGGPNWLATCQNGQPGAEMFRLQDVFVPAGSPLVLNP